MKRTFLLRFLLLAYTYLVLLSSVTAQSEPVAWSISLDSVESHQGTLIFKARILPGWHLYSQYIAEGGPIPTTFKYYEKGYATVGKTLEKGKRTVYHDQIYDMEVAYYADNATFLQRVNVMQPNGFAKGVIEYMVCSGEVCVPCKKEFIVAFHMR